MKKSFLALFISLGLVANAFAQEEVAAVADSTDNSVAKSEQINHWSLAVKGGIDYLRAADQKVNFEIGGVVERTFNPRWGMGLEYMFLKNDHEACFGNPEMEGYNHDIALFGSVNLSNIIAPYRSAGWQKLNWFANAGLGATIYGYEFEGSEKETGAKLLGVVSTDLEYNVAKYIALFLEAQYRMNSNNEQNGFSYGRSFIGANFGVRVMFGGERNIRNIAWADYIPGVEMPDFGSIFDAQKAEMEAKAAEQQKAIDAQNEQIKKLQQQIKFTQDSLDRHIEKTKPKKAYTPTVEESEVIKRAMSNLEFETGKAVIKNESFAYLDLLANMLKKHPQWSVVVKGHTDNVGNADKNLQLSKDRAAAVSNYLISKGVQKENIESEGLGQTKPIASNNTKAGRAKNRRVEIDMYTR